MDEQIKETETSIIDIARATIYYYSYESERCQYDFSALLDPIGIQKRLYFSQMISLHYFNRALFKEDFEAWPYGPVEPILYKTKKYTPELLNLEYSPITYEEFIINLIFNSLKNMPNMLLSDISHEDESAWRRCAQRQRISKKSIKENPSQRIIKEIEIFLEKEKNKEYISLFDEGEDILDFLVK